LNLSFKALLRACVLLATGQQLLHAALARGNIAFCMPGASCSDEDQDILPGDPKRQRLFLATVLSRVTVPLI
jgi:hypothetical protein